MSIEDKLNIDPQPKPPSEFTPKVISDIDEENLKDNFVHMINQGNKLLTHSLRIAQTTEDDKVLNSAANALKALNDTMSKAISFFNSQQLEQIIEPEVVEDNSPKNITDIINMHNFTPKEVEKNGKRTKEIL